MKREVLVMGPFYAPKLAELERRFTAHKLWLEKDRDAYLASVAERITAVASSGARGIDAATMDKLPKLELIAHFGVGVDSVDTEAAKQRGIAVTNTPDVLTEDVADLAMALLLATVRRIPQGDRFVREGNWARAAFPLTDTLQGRTLGIVGMGRIGRAIARRAEAFNLRVAYQGPNRKADAPWPHFASPAALARECDFLAIACPGGEATRGLVDREVIEALGPQGVLVNISRGSVVDEPALLAALKDGRLGAAGLDVFYNEPRIDAAFLALDNVVLQPHVGSATHPTRAAMGQLVIDNLEAFFAGEPLRTRYA
ncbi:MAG TPA: 2-hydroxyacid dehydrogenase [Usitatibacter sp.]|nr:2-hydroxyacid dehydrogenase [Usitatibacter sp.]